MKDILTAPFVKEMCDTTANMYRLGWDERMVVISAICLMKKKLHNILILIMC